MITIAYYVDPSGRTGEFHWKSDRAPKYVFTRGQCCRVFRSVTRTESKCERGRVADPWVDHYSMRLMVNPDTVPAQMAEDARRGVPTEYNEHGMPHFTGTTHRRKYLRAYPEHGWVDKDSYY